MRSVLLCCLLLLITACAGRPAWEQIDPGRQAEAYTHLGWGLFEEGYYQRAVREFDRALQVQPRLAPAHHGMALALQAQGEHLVAEQHFRRAVQLAPQLTAARNNYAAFLFNQNRYDEARRQLEQASQDLIYEQRWLIFENLGYVALQQGQPELALSDFNRALRLNPQRLTSRYEVMRLLLEMDRLDDAAQQWSFLAPFAAAQRPILLLGIEWAERTGDQQQEQRLKQLLRETSAEGRQ